MNGHVLDELPIAVDCFKNTKNVQLFFLTHAHSDHTMGLTSSWQSKIHCTELTAKLASHRLGVRRSCFQTLELQQDYILTFRNKNDSCILHVTALPANHCPGSCMFVFETDNTKILYTGDVKPNRQLYEIGKDVWGLDNRKIDVLYVDNTYAEPACRLPPPKEAFDEIIRICQLHEDCSIFLGVYWTGHEDLLVEISTKLGRLIAVTREHLKVLTLVGDVTCFTTDKYESDLHAMPMGRLTKSFMQEMNETEKAIGIVPTGRRCHKNHSTEREDCIYYVPLSHHPSYSELCELIRVTGPEKIKPVVSGSCGYEGMASYSRADMSQFNHVISGRCQASPNPFTILTTAKSAEGVAKSTVGRKCGVRNVRKKSRTAKPVGVVFED